MGRVPGSILVGDRSDWGKGAARAMALAESAFLFGRFRIRRAGARRITVLSKAQRCDENDPARWREHEPKSMLEEKKTSRGSLALMGFFSLDEIRSTTDYAFLMSGWKLGPNFKLSPGYCSCLCR